MFLIGAEFLYLVRVLPATLGEKKFILCLIVLVER